MAVGQVVEERVNRLADEVRAKIIAKAALIAESEGEIIIRVFRRGPGFDVKLTITTG